MVRKLVVTVLAFVFCVGLTIAAEVSGSLSKVDVDGGKITIKNGKKMTTLPVAIDVKVKNDKGEDIKEGIKSEKLKENVDVILTTSGKKKNAVVTEIKLK